MNKMFKILFFNSMIMGTLIAISSYSWFSMWMGLEINLLSVIPLFLNPKNTYSTEASMKYFISQAIASTIILFSMISMLMKNQTIMPLESIMSIAMNSMLMLKMGAAPLHFWFPEVMEGLSWMNCLIMLTWQKISPMIIIFNNKPNTSLMMIFIFSSLMISAILSFNQTSLRKILTYSSINHISWMLSSMLYSISTWILYFLVYSTMSIMITIMMNKFNYLYVNQMINKSKKMNLLMMINFLSMGGLPPFTGFLPKWITINKLTQEYSFLLSTCLILSALIMLFVYMRMFFSLLMMSSSMNKMPTPSNNSPMLTISTVMVNSSLIMFTILFNLN